MTKLFLSYRRQDSSPETGRLVDDLQQHIAREHFFLDHKSITPGADFKKAIQRTISGCSALIAIIGPGWLDCRNEEGYRRIDEPEDFVRLEIRAALEQGVLVIPTLVGGATLMKATELPACLSTLPTRQCIALHESSWRRDAAQLAYRLLGIPGITRTVNESRTDARIKLAELGANYEVSAFLDAIENRDHVAAHLFLVAGMNPNARASVPNSRNVNDFYVRQRNGYQSALSIAAGQGDMRLTALLMDRGPDIDPVLPLATVPGFAPVLDLLLDRGPGQDALDIAFAAAARLKNREAMAVLIGKGISDAGFHHTFIDIAEPSRTSDLRTLALHREIPPSVVTRALLKALQKAKFDRSSPDDVVAVTALLLSFVAEVHTEEEEDKCVWEGAIGEQMPLEIVKMLLAQGANPDQIYRSKDHSPDYKTPLIHAIVHRRVDTVEYLLEQGADPTLPAKGITPLMIAASRGQGCNIVNALLAQGVDVNVGHEERTALNHTHDPERFTRLLDAGAEIASCDRLLRKIVSNREFPQIQLLRLMQHAGLDLDAADEAGVTPLMIAAGAGNDDAVRCLLLAGVRADAHDHVGRQAQDYALAQAHEAVKHTFSDASTWCDDTIADARSGEHRFSGG